MKRMKLKTVKKILYAILALAVLLIIIMGITRQIAYGYAAIAVAAGYIVVISAFYRCPNCDRRLGRIDDRIKYCRLCGQEIKWE